MIAAATQIPGIGKPLFGWFDVALVLLVAFGFWRGRKNGMSKEFLPVSLWLAIVVAAGFGNELVGDQFIQWGAIKAVFGKSINEKTAACISAYLLITLAVWLAFYFIRNHLKAKLEGSNAFGAGEYYLGICAGIIRYLCMATFALALLHAPYYSPAEIQAKIIYNNKVYGGGLSGFSGDFFPTVDEVQAAVFKDSLIGPSLGIWLSAVLINSVPPSGPAKTPVIDIH